MKQILLCHKGNSPDTAFRNLAMKEHLKEQNLEANGIRSLFAYLKHLGHNVYFENFSNTNMNTIIKQLMQSKPDIIGMTCYTINRHTVFKMCELFKKILPKVVTVIGGPHASSLPEDILNKHGEVDFVVIGEGEQTLLDLIGAIEESEENPSLDLFKKIPGLAFRSRDGVVTTPRREPIEDLGIIPHAAPWMSYKNISVSRGCPGNCTFCASPFFWNKKIRHRPVEDILDEIQTLRSKYRIRDFIFADDTFAMSRTKLEEICQGLESIQPGFKWSCTTRVDVMDEEKARMLRKAGCYRVSLGIESGSKKLREVMGKPVDRDNILDVTRILRQAGIETRHYYIVGTPGETEDTVNSTINLIMDSRPHYVATSIMTILPGTKLFEECKKKGTLNESIWETDRNPTPPGTIYTADHTYEWLLGMKKRIDLSYEKSKASWGMTLEEITGALGFAPDQADLHNKAAIIYNRSGMDEPAFKALSKSVELDPMDFMTNYYLGATLFNMGKNREAHRFLTRSKKLNPRHDPTRKLLKKIKRKK